MIKKILWISDSMFYQSSLGKVSNQIISGLLATKKYEIYHYGFQNHKGSDLQYGNLILLSRGKSALHGRDIVERVAKENDISVVVDYSGGSHIPKRFYIYLMDTNAKIVSYPFVDNIPPSRVETELLKIADCIVPPTEFLRGELLKAEPSLANTTHKPILHPIDLELYKPMKKQEARKLIFQANYDTVKNKFIVSFVGANQWRKGIIELFTSFSLFLKEYPDALLLMVTNPKPEPTLEYEGYDLEVEAMRYGIADNIFILQNIPEEMMPAVYNASDLSVLLTKGGVTELPLLEAMACGIPILTTDASVMKYLLNESNSGIGVKVEKKIPLTIVTKTLLHPNAFDTLGNYPALMEAIFGESFFGYSCIPSVEDAVDKLKTLVNNPQMRDKLGRNGYKFIRSLPISPSEVIRKWDELFSFLAP